MEKSDLKYLIDSSISLSEKDKGIINQDIDNAPLSLMEKIQDVIFNVLQFDNAIKDKLKMIQMITSSQQIPPYEKEEYVQGILENNTTETFWKSLMSALKSCVEENEQRIQEIQSQELPEIQARQEKIHQEQRDDWNKDMQELNPQIKTIKKNIDMHAEHTVRTEELSLAQQVKETLNKAA
ncbi:hypothetical protein COB57_04400 [Candidatus Peregrinibacteria bacterium]|nr:MAG: hypothetical protein COB57_04400 [Candidatus Peregrinibacteria bacterium]